MRLRRSFAVNRSTFFLDPRLVKSQQKFNGGGVKSLYNELANESEQSVMAKLPSVCRGVDNFCCFVSKKFHGLTGVLILSKKQLTVTTDYFRFHTMNISMIISWANSTDHLLQNSLRDIAILNWAANNTIGPECCNLGADASNVFACPATHDGQELLPVDLTSTPIQKFSFPGEWILDLSKSKGMLQKYINNVI